MKSHEINGSSQLVAGLAAIVGDSGVLTGDELSRRACSYWDSSPLNSRALVRPRTTIEISKVLALGYNLGQPVVTNGGLTGCVGETVVGEDEVVLSLERMTRIEEIDSVGRTAIIQAGAVLQVVKEAVAEQNIYFALDLGARGSCTIGGNVANNASGISVIRYGMMREQVLGLEAVLVDGTIIYSLNHMLKNNAGYDLKQLFIGTEGTLGIITRVVVKLRDAYRSRNTALMGVDSFSSVIRLLKFTEGTLGGLLSAFEVMWGDYFHADTVPGWHRVPMDRNFPYYVIVEANGASLEFDTPQFVTCLQ